MRSFIAGLCLLGAPALASAQVFTGGEFERQLRPGYNIPYDGQPWSHRYGYSTDMSYFYLHGSGYRLNYLEYNDRVTRALQNGYAVPFDPRYEFPAQIGEIVPMAPAPEAAAVETAPPLVGGRLGLGFGIFRRR
ncbi:MAG: hypothetical protein NZO58_04990 [Gemmataceae bacterium]|nr:hypothetical protein [Gemmataceae bacterium]